MNSVYYNRVLISADYAEGVSVDPLYGPAARLVPDIDPRNKYKTEICRNWESGLCGFSESCVFAHGYDELRNKIGMGNSYKTKKCKQFHELGYCIYGNRCQFKHRDSSAETASSPKAVPQEIKKIPSDHNKRRLKVFVDIEKNGEMLYN